MKFISIIVLSLLSITVSAVVIDRPSSSELTAVIREKMVADCLARAQKRRSRYAGDYSSTGTGQQSTETNHVITQSTANSDNLDNSVKQSNGKMVEESLARIKQRKCKYTGDCSSTGTGQQSTETSHDVAQSTVDPNDLDNSVKQSKQSDESPSSSQSKQSDDIFDITTCSDPYPLPESYVSKNEQFILTPRQKLDRIERMMKKIGMDIPSGAENTYPYKVNAEAKQRIQEAIQTGRRMTPFDRRNLMRLKLAKAWICYNLELESFKEMSINAVSEPNPKPNPKPSESTSKSHGSKQSYFKIHQSKSNRQENQSTLSAWKLKLKIKKPKLPKLTVYSKSMFGN
ncbi:hypothetical protein RTP6_007634 [Batrachochytrium dendrobatidis]